MGFLSKLFNVCHCELSPVGYHHGHGGRYYNQRTEVVFICHKCYRETSRLYHGHLSKDEIIEKFGLYKRDRSAV